MCACARTCPSECGGVSVCGASSGVLPQSLCCTPSVGAVVTAHKAPDCLSLQGTPPELRGVIVTDPCRRTACWLFKVTQHVVRGEPGPPLSARVPTLSPASHGREPGPDVRCLSWWVGPQVAPRGAASRTAEQGGGSGSGAVIWLVEAALGEGLRKGGAHGWPLGVPDG